jgi:hypothetical protein
MKPIPANYMVISEYIPRKGRKISKNYAKN